MNKVFRIIWNAAMQRFVVVSELAKGKVKSQSSSTSTSAPNRLAFSGVAAALLLALNPLSAMAVGTVIADNEAKVYSGVDIVATGNRATVGQNSMGLSAGNGGSIDFTRGSLTTKGTGGVGAMANNNSSIALNGTPITTAGDTAHGMMSQNGSTITAEGVNIITSGRMAYGVQTFNGAASMSNGAITTSGVSAVGAWTQGETGDLTLNKTAIITTGSNAHGLYAMTGGQSTFNNGAISTADNDSHGAYANGAGSTININDSRINTAGSAAGAVYASDGGTVNLTNTNLSTSVNSHYVLRATGEGSTVNFDTGNITTENSGNTVQALSGGQLNIRNATINTAGIAINAQGGSKANLENLVINTSATGIFITSPGGELNANNIKINSLGSNNSGIQFEGDAVGKLNNIEINQAGVGRGIDIYNGSSLSGDNIRIVIDANDTSVRSHGIGMHTSGNESVASLSNSQIVLKGTNTAGLQLGSMDVSGSQKLSLNNSLVEATEGTAMMVYGNSDATVTASGSVLTGITLLSAGVDNNGTVSNVELSGDNGSVFNGDVVIDRANTAKNIINLDHNSAWNGSTTSLGNLNVTNGSAWNVTQSSAVDNLTLDNGTLNMTAEGTGYSEVTVGNLTSNNGTIDFKTHLMGDDSDTDDLIVTGNYSGNSNVVVQNAGGTGAKTLNGTELIRVDGTIDGTFTQQDRIVAGAYDYKLVQDGNKWLLRNDVIGGEGGDIGAPDLGDTTGTAAIARPEGGSYAANLAAANTLFTTSLDDRLGETHYIGADGKKHSTSLWMRNAGGHTRFSDSSGQLKTTGNRYVMQLGGDIAQWSSNGDDRFHIGVMGGYANAQSNTVSSVTGYSAKGEVHGYSTGVYATWLQDNAVNTGAYVDSWMLYNWFDNSVKGQGIAAENYKSEGITASVETGYSFKMADLSPRSSFYLQPKAQVTWMGVEADDHKESNGTRVTGEGNNNVQTRLGVRAYVKGHNPIDDGKNRTFEPFIEANWIHNTESFGSSLNGVAVKQAGTRDVGEVKVGVDAKLNNTVNLWGNIGQQIGDKGYSDTSAMVGLKVNF